MGENCPLPHFKIDRPLVGVTGEVLDVDLADFTSATPVDVNLVSPAEIDVDITSSIELDVDIANFTSATPV